MVALEHVAALLFGKFQGWDVVMIPVSTRPVPPQLMLSAWDARRKTDRDSRHLVNTGEPDAEPVAAAERSHQLEHEVEDQDQGNVMVCIRRFP